MWLPFPADTLNDAVLRQAEETKTAVFRGWSSTELPEVAKTEVLVSGSALDWSAADIVTAARAFVSYLGLPGPAG
jgi:hypothetical protein